MSDPYAAPVRDADADEESDESELPQPTLSPDQPFAAYGGTAGFIFNVLL